MTTYITNTELYHYGVIGMRWGVRKNRDEYYTKRSNLSAAKAAKARTRLGKKFHTDRSIDFKEMARTSRAMSKTRGKQRFWTKHGNRRNASIANAMAEKNEYRSKIARTKVGSDFSKANAKNFSELSKSYTSIANRKGFIRKLAKTIDRSIHQPYHKMSGRTTTLGRQGVRNIAADIIPYGNAINLAAEVGEYSYARYKKRT